MMRKDVVFFVFLLALFGFDACSTDVNLYADYKDVPIVYGLIDVNADTNFVKISRAFCGSNDNPIDANEVALIADSCNYPGKLKACIVELRNTYGQTYEPTGREFELDTVTIHNKEEGLFYAPDQKLYYTTEKFKKNNGGNKYRYRLEVVKPNGDTISSVTTPVGGDLEIMSVKANFTPNQSNATEQLVFRSSNEAVLYDIKMQFNYWEEHAGQARTKKNVSWSYGARPLSGYEDLLNGIYGLDYSVNVFFNALRREIGNDTVWDFNHPNVTRYIDDFVVTMSVGGRELYESYEINLVLENGLNAVAYSNIEGGFGLFSSRTNVIKTVGLSASTKRHLFSLRSWGFVEQ